MQHHPDTAELVSYALGNSQTNVANSVIEHLLVCDHCIRQVKLHSEYHHAELAVVKSVVKKLNDGLDHEAAFATINRPPAARTHSAPAHHAAWALLVPLVLAVALQSSTTTQPTAGQRMVAQTAEPIVRFFDRPVYSDVIQDEPTQEVSAEPEVVRPVRARVRREPAPEFRYVRTFVPPHRGEYSVRYPVLLEPEYQAPVFRTVRLNASEALSLVDTEISLAPPPRRPAKFRRFMSALIAPFRSRS